MQLAHLDRGDGPPVVFVHGTPSSSFEFRHVMEDLERDHRVIAVDHLGFGQSPKPPGADYSLHAHQQRFRQFLDEAEVQDAVFVLHDFGTAIALPALLDSPKRCKGIVLLNTFLWPATGPLSWLLRFYATGFGRWIYRTFNLSVGMLLPFAWGSRKPLTPELHAAYQAPLSTAEDRISTAVLPGELVGSTLGELSGQVGDMRQWPVQIVWGRADRVVSPQALARWKHHLGEVPTIELDDVGHFVAEEAPDVVAKVVRNAMACSTAPSAE